MKILWVKSDFLHPTTRGGQIRTLETLKRLHSRHEIHYVAYDNPAQPEGLKRAGEYCSRAYPVLLSVPPRRSFAFAGQFVRNLFSSMPLSLSRYRSTAMQKQIATLQNSVPFDCVVSDFLAPAPNFESLGNVMMFQHNVETLIWRRHVEHAGDPLRKLYFKSQADRMFCWEQRMCRAVRRVIAVSSQDAEAMCQMFGVTCKSVPTGVDIEYFRRPERPAPQADIVFVGSMDWMPNTDGVEYFVREILPLIRQRVPECAVAIVGRSPSRATLALAERDARIQVTGTVPDVRPWLWGAKLSIVPLRIGGGTRLKIYESMAAGTPVVSTTNGAEGLEVEDPTNIHLADSPCAFADRCTDLLDGEDERRRVAAAAFSLVSSRFSWDAVAAEFEKLLFAAVNSPEAAEPTANSVSAN
jgi:glycosyltransferase involved in cell wall biosynthesis